MIKKLFIAFAVFIVGCGEPSINDISGLKIVEYDGKVFRDIPSQNIQPAD